MACILLQINEILGVDENMSQITPNLCVHFSAQGGLAIHESYEQVNFFSLRQRTESLLVHL